LPEREFLSSASGRRPRKTKMRKISADFSPLPPADARYARKLFYKNDLSHKMVKKVTLDIRPLSVIPAQPTLIKRLIAKTIEGGARQKHLLFLPFVTLRF